MVKALFQREVFGPFPPPRDDDDSSDSLPAVLDCGFGGGGWIDRVLEEHQGNLDVRQIAKVMVKIPYSSQRHNCEVSTSMSDC